MIKVTIFRDGNWLVGLAVAGHSHYRPQGEDIICSAISALSQTAIPALEQVAGITPDYSRTEGRLVCKLPPGMDRRELEAAQAVLQTVVIGMQCIAQQYPRHVTVINKEV